MSTSYGVILREVVLKAGMLYGQQIPVSETAYITTPLTKAEIGEGRYPFTALKDAVLDAEGKLALSIANTGNSPFRAYLISTTSPLANQAVLPNLDVHNEQIIGVWGSINDVATGNVCFARSREEIERRVRNANGQFKIPVYWFDMDDLMIYHTRDTVTAHVCVYTRSIQSTVLDANGNMLLPDALAEALVCGALSYLLSKEMPAETAVYSSYFQAAIQDVSKGLSSVTSKAMPTPINI